MDANASTSARRTEDIALDLLKFVAAHANVGRPTAQATPGFAPANPPRSEDPVQGLLDLYGRCRAAVESPTRS